MDAYNSLTNDQSWIESREKFHPGLDILLSLQKSHEDYWSTEAGWLQKKSKRSVKTINWKSTFTNALTFRSNQVWKQRKQFRTVSDM